MAKEKFDLRYTNIRLLYIFLLEYLFCISNIKKLKLHLLVKFESSLLDIDNLVYLGFELL